MRYVDCVFVDVCGVDEFIVGFDLVGKYIVLCVVLVFGDELNSLLVNWSVCG